MTVNLNIRMESEIKNQAEAFFADMGLSMTTAINMFVRQALKQRKIPFEILSEYDPFYSLPNLRALDRSIQAYQEGRTVTKTWEELRAMEE